MDKSSFRSFDIMHFDTIGDIINLTSRNERITLNLCAFINFQRASCVNQQFFSINYSLDFYQFEVYCVNIDHRLAMTFDVNFFFTLLQSIKITYNFRLKNAHYSHTEIVCVCDFVLKKNIFTLWFANACFIIININCLFTNVTLLTVVLAPRTDTITQINSELLLNHGRLFIVHCIMFRERKKSSASFSILLLLTIFHSKYWFNRSLKSI